MALQSYGDYLLGQGFYQDPDTGSWRREDQSGVEHLDAQDRESPLYQDWASQQNAALPKGAVQTDPFNQQSIQFQDPSGKWYFNNSNTYDPNTPVDLGGRMAVASDYYTDAGTGLAGNSIESQEMWAREHQQDSWGESITGNMPVVFASILLGGALGPVLGGAIGTSSTVAGGAIGGGVMGGFSGEEPSLTGAVKGAALGALGGGAKGLIGEALGGSFTGAIPDSTPTGTFPDSGALSGGGQLELLSGTVTDPNAAALTQMGVDAGLSGEALQAFVDSGGGAGSTAAGGGGAQSLSNLISGGEVPSTPQDPGYVTDPNTGDTVSSGQTPNAGGAPTPSVPEGGRDTDVFTPSNTTPTGAGYDPDYSQNTPTSGVKSILNLINENKGLATLGTGIIGSLIQGATAPAAAKAKAEAEAEAAKQLENDRRAATSMSGVRFGVRPTGRMLRSPGLIGRPV
jgi:hypothetical protein